MPDTSHPRAQEAMGLERLRKVMDALHEGVAIVNAEGVVDFINASGEQILNVAAGEVGGWRLLDLRWEIVDEAGQPLPRETHPALRVLETGKDVPTVVLGLCSPSINDQDIRWVEVSARPLMDVDETKPHGSVSTFRDVTRRVEAEEALRASEDRYELLARSVPTGIFRSDASGGWVWVNRAWTEVAGRSLEESVGSGWLDAVHPDDRSRVSAEWQKAVRTGDPCRLEYRIVGSNGVIRWVLFRSTPYIRQDGISVGHIGSVTDITEAKTAELFKDQLLGLASHELRAPLIAIRGGLTFLEPYIRDADEDGRLLFGIAHRNALLLERLVRDLLDIERLEGGRIPLKLGRIALHGLLREVRDLTLVQAVERGVVVEKPVGEDIELAVDRDRIMQVLTNLVTNAVKFSEPGGQVRLEIEARQDGAVVSVHDQGRGIPVEMLERVFERFVQVLPSDSVERGGAGLGLAIARAIVQRHGGRIWVESEPGSGASFYVFLPETPKEAHP